VVATVTRPAVSRNNSRAPATGSNVLSVSKRPNTHPAPPGGFEGSHMATWIVWVPKTSSGPLARDDASADPSDPNHGTSVLTR
jgi:hypothetical protein